jgi:GT2 family glycosyltransferase
MDPDDVTLIVPCYNVEDSLERALAAVAALDPAPARVLCIDDGSTDGTRDAIESSAGVDLVAHPYNRGLAAALNTGLDRTETPGLAKVDADIVVESDWLGRMCAAIADSEAALVQGRFVEEVTTVADEWRRKHPSPTFPDEPLVDVPINGSNIVCRTRALRAVDGWDERYVRAFDDIDLVLRLIDAGYRVYYTPDVVTRHARTDTWREVLRTAWSYHYDSRSGRDAPRGVGHVLLRLPGLLYNSGVGIASDLRDGDFELLWISLLRPFYHVKWDVEAVLRKNAGGDGGG